jgi:hypothetical protein
MWPIAMQGTLTPTKQSIQPHNKPKKANKQINALIEPVSGNSAQTSINKPLGSYTRKATQQIP